MPGFAVRVGTSGTKSFFVYTRIKGVPKRMTLKPQYPALTLADAREAGRSDHCRRASRYQPGA